MKVTIYTLANSADEKSRRQIVHQFDAPLPDLFDPQKDVPEEIEVHVANSTEHYTYDAIEEPSPGHTRFRVLIPDGFQIITVSTTTDTVSIEVERTTVLEARPHRWRW